MTDAIEFFYTHAGYGYDPSTETPEQGKRKGAEKLAKAEYWAQVAGLIFSWADDPDTTEDDFECAEDKAHVRQYGAVRCILYRPCLEHGIDCKHAEVLESLWGITESPIKAERDAYRRIVQAELALEVMPEGE